MTITAFPLDPVAGVPTYAAGDVRAALSAVMGRAPSGRPLGVSSGVRPGSPTALVTANSSTWTVVIHSGLIDQESPATTGPVLYALTADVSGSMAAANATNGRIDLISVQISDPSTGDGTSVAEVDIVYTVGTPGAVPVAPSAPARSFTLATIFVPHSGAGAPAVTVAANPWGDTGDLITGITAPSGGAITSQTYRRSGNVVSAYFDLTTPSSMPGVGSSGNYLNVVVAHIPTGFRPSSTAALSSGGSGPMLAAVVSSNGDVLICAGPPGYTLAAGSAVSFGGTWFVED